MDSQCFAPSAQHRPRLKCPKAKIQCQISVSQPRYFRLNADELNVGISLKEGKVTKRCTASGRIAERPILLRGQLQLR